jgi:hypothetical protein
MKLAEGTKYDQGKPRWDLVPPEFEEVVRVLTYGASKYEARNWEKGISYGRLVAALLRHLWAWIGGERNDPETGIHHLAHAVCDGMFLLTFEIRGMKEFDDRAFRSRSDGTSVHTSGSGNGSDLPAPTEQEAGRSMAGLLSEVKVDPQVSFQPFERRGVDPLELSVHTAS